MASVLKSAADDPEAMAKKYPDKIANVSFEKRAKVKKDKRAKKAEGVLGFNPFFRRRRRRHHLKRKGEIAHWDNRK